MYLSSIKGREEGSIPQPSKATKPSLQTLLDSVGHTYSRSSHSAPWFPVSSNGSCSSYLQSLQQHCISEPCRYSLGVPLPPGGLEAIVFNLLTSQQDSGSWGPWLMPTAVIYALTWPSPGCTGTRPAWSVA